MVSGMLLVLLTRTDRSEVRQSLILNKTPRIIFWHISRGLKPEKASKSFQNRENWNMDEWLNAYVSRKVGQTGPIKFKTSDAISFYVNTDNRVTCAQTSVISVIWKG